MPKPKPNSKQSIVNPALYPVVVLKKNCQRNLQQLRNIADQSSSKIPRHAQPHQVQVTAEIPIQIPARASREPWHDSWLMPQRPKPNLLNHLHINAI